MRLLIDEAIPRHDLFASFGDVETFPGRKLDRARLKSADALIIRSVTRVDAALLDGSRVRFVGTATTGLDHIDTDYLSRQRIHLAAAVGSNCRGVAEYVLAAILQLCRRWGGAPAGKTLGIIGRGRIGSLLAEWAAVSGLKVLACDPPLAQTGESGLVQFDRLAAEADIVSLHVPLTDAGPHATRNMVDAAWLAHLQPGAWLINTSRGQVVDEKALGAALRAARLGAAVLDVWQNEPTPDPHLVAAATIATPHIAGYTVESKLRAAEMLAAALAGWASQITPVASDARAPRMPPAAPSRNSITVPPGMQYMAAVSHVLNHAVGLLTTDLAFRDMVADRDPPAFDALRTRCANRREFTAFSVDSPLPPETCEILKRLGFDVAARA